VPSIAQPLHPRHGTTDGPEEVLLGVDTHKDFHAAAVITTVGATLDGRSFPATADGYRQLLAWARSFGTLRRAGVECTGSYGAALTRYLRSAGIEVTEVNQPDKAARRRHGKTDAVDAEAAARAVLSGRATATAKAADGSSTETSPTTSPAGTPASPPPEGSSSRPDSTTGQGSPLPRFFGSPGRVRPVCSAQKARASLWRSA
jgi:transposase